MPCLRSLSVNADKRQVAETFIDIETVADDKFVGNGKCDVVHFRSMFSSSVCVFFE